jgi:hypothetical protein
MKKIIAGVCLLMVYSTASSQVAVAVKGGWVSSNTNSRTAGQKISSNSISAFQLGALIDVNITGGLYLQPEVLYIHKGSKGNFFNQFIVITDRVQYIDVPVAVAYKYSLGKGKLMVGFGPYLGFGVGGTRESRANLGITTTVNETKINFGKEKNADDYTVTDIGLVFKLGYELSNKFFIQGNYNLGLKDNLPGGDDNNFRKHRYFGITIGYFIKSGK